MKDIFLEYETKYRNLAEKQDLLNKYNIYYMDIINDFFNRIIETKKGNDSMCLDYMDFSEYIRGVSKDFSQMVKKFNEEIANLEKELIKPSFDYNAICSLISVSGMISCNFLLELFKELGIEYREVHFHNGIHDEEGMTLAILDNGEYKRYSFFGSNYVISMLEVKDEEIIFDSKLEYLLGTDFIRFYVNYKYNTGFCDIKTICREYKNTCLNR